MATFGTVSSSMPNVLFNPMAVDQAVQGRQRNQLMMDNARQDQQFQQQDRQQQTFQRDATARIGLARQMADAPDLDTQWGPAVRQMQAAGLGQGLNPDVIPPRERLRAIGASDLTTFQRMQMEHQRQNSAFSFGPGGGAPVATSAGAGGAAPAVGGRPFAAANLPQGVDPQTDQMVRTVLGEAGGEDDRGMQAVAHTVLNRARQSGQSTEQVIFAPNQFEPWNNPRTRAGLEAIDPNSPQYQRALEQVRRVQAGEAPDPTGGATHFYSPTAQAGLGRQAPSWDNGQGQDIGRHRFFNLGFGSGSGAPGAPQQQAAAPPAAGPAARTGGTDMAGPGVPAAPPAADAPRMLYRGNSPFTDGLPSGQAWGQTADGRRVAMDIPGARMPRQPAEPTGPYTGTGIEAQDSNILLTGDPSSRAYAGAYARQAAPRVLLDGSRITPDMRPYEQPRFGAASPGPVEAGPGASAATEPARAPGQPTVTLTATPTLTPALVEMRQETEDKLAGLTSARGALDAASELSAKAYAGPLASLRGRVAGVSGYDAATATATTQFNSIMTEQALSQLRSIFGGNPTEGERKILVDMQASPDMSRAERDALISRAQVAVRTREEAAQRRLTEIRQGTYGRTDPNYTPPPSPPPPSNQGGGWSIRPVQ